MKNKHFFCYGIIYFLLIAGCIVSVYYGKNLSKENVTYEDGVESIDANTIVLLNSGAEVTFSEVILSQPQETRKLVVFEQEAEVSFTIKKSRLLKWNALSQSQNITYKAKGQFVVDLDSLTEENIIDNSDENILTIKIEHPYLDAIVVDPDKISLEDTENGILSFGDLVLPVDDFVEIEKELQDRLEAELDTSANGQAADDIAIEMVTAIYEPVVKAVDKDYTLVVEFQ